MITSLNKSLIPGVAHKENRPCYSLKLKSPASKTISPYNATTATWYYWDNF